MRAENRAIKARLERLEQAVFKEQTITPISENLVFSSGNGTSHIRTDAEAVEADQDSHWLELMGARADTILPKFADRVMIRLQTLEQLLASEQSLPEVRNISLPTHDVAVAFLDAYATHLDSVQHILHIDSTRQMLDDTYARLENGEDIDPGALCLILGICAGVGFYWTVGSSSGDALFDDHETARRVSAVWAKHSLYAMEQLHLGTAEHSLEAVQSMVMLTFLFYHMEGFTSRVRLMHSSAITIAMSLGLHKTDAPNLLSPPTNQTDIVDKEVRRKVWWHLACTDWILSFMGGAQEGMYSVGTQHMRVNLPRNLNRHDLSTKGSDFTRPYTEPTIMSYYLQRIKLASTCREITDQLWHSIHDTDPGNVDCELVARLDAMFDKQLQELPRFMRLEIPRAQLETEYGDSYTPSLDTQRTTLHLMLNTRRCKLHMPFLVRAKTTAGFATSRAIGLRSARAVFATRRYAMSTPDSFGAIHLKLGGLVQHVFFATIVLVMDLCINRDDAGATMAEVREGLQIMDESKESSQMGKRFHESLVNILRKHNVNLPSTETAPQLQRSDVLKNGTSNVLTNQSTIDSDLPSSGFELDGMWQDFLNIGPNLQPREWDALLSDLDMQP